MRLDGAPQSPWVAGAFGVFERSAGLGPPFPVIVGVSRGRVAFPSHRGG